MKKHINEIKIAIVAIVGIVALFLGFNFLKGINVFSSNHGYYLMFDNINGLTTSTTVFANGYPVGTITNIEYDYQQKNKIKVLADLDEQLQVPQGTTAKISSDVMGNVKVVLDMALPAGQYLKPGDEIPGVIDNGSVGEITAMIPTVKQMIPKLDSIVSSLNSLLADPAIKQSLHHIEVVSNNLTTSTQQLNTLLTGINRDLPNMVTKANTALDNTTQFTSKLATVDVEGTMNKVNQTLVNVQEVTDKINHSNGSLGLLLKDPSLYYNLNSTVSNADSLVKDLKQNPKRYVHFSIFGRKN